MKSDDFMSKTLKWKKIIILIIFLIIFFIANSKIVSAVFLEEFYPPFTDLDKIASAGFKILFIMGILIIILGYYFNVFNKFVLKKIIIPSYLVSIFFYIFIIASKLGSLKSDVTAGTPPFYARWDFISIWGIEKSFVNSSFIFFVLIVLFFSSYFVFKTIKSLLVFFTLLIVLSFLITIFINLQIKTFVGGDTDFLESVKTIIIGKFKDSESEYVGDINKVKENFLSDYIKILPASTPGIHYLSIHSSTHPPGPILLYWLFSKISPSLLFLGFINILIGSAGLIPTYLIASKLYGDTVGRAAAWLYMFIPAVILYSATSFDATMPFFFGILVYFFLRSLEKLSFLNIIIFGILVVVNLLLNFAVGLVSPFFLIFFIINYKIIKKPILKLLLLTSSFALFQFLLFWFFNYNIFKVIAIAKANQQLFMAPFPRPYWYFLFGGPATFFFFLGIPLITLIICYIREIFRKIRKKKSFYFDSLFISCVLTIIIVDAAGYVGAESARIWLFLMPLFLISLTFFAFKYFRKIYESIVVSTAFLLFLQTIIIEICLDTYW